MLKIKTFITVVIAFFSVFTLQTAATAHPNHYSSLNMYVYEDKIVLEAKMSPATINETLGINLTETANPAQLGEVSEYVSQHISVISNDAKLNITPLETVFETGEESNTVLVYLEANGADIGEQVIINADFITESDQTHLIYLSLISDWQTGELAYDEPINLATLSSSNSEHVLDRSNVSAGSGFLSSMGIGFGHILGGFDHLLFLAMLLIPAPLLINKVGNKISWGERREISGTLKRIVWIVTAFTVGHSLTLALVTLTDFKYPLLATELLVAFSVALAAVHAIKPLIAKGEILIAVVFGLVHGTAFSGTIQYLNLEGWALVQALLAFNIGVELGQLLVLTIVLPIIWVLSRWNKYNILRISIAVLGIIAATYWGVTLIIEA